MPKQWIKEHQKEHFYRSAKKEGYRARSAFKLIYINNKFKIFRNVYTLLDLGCAPGSWLQVSKEFIDANIQKHKKIIAPKLLGVDIEKMSPIEGVNFIQMNINDNSLESEINGFSDNEQLDLIISDCSINKTGNKTLDQVSQIRVCNRVVEIATQFLKPDRFLVLKCFEGSELSSFIRNLKKKFQMVKKFIPEATRSRSSELYLICRSIIKIKK
jgi:23S rRNA (uridine2552-2'-O)-methyltransferase